jgi:hypothetical protein
VHDVVHGLRNRVLVIERFGETVRGPLGQPGANGPGARKQRKDLIQREQRGGDRACSKERQLRSDVIDLTASHAAVIAGAARSEKAPLAIGLKDEAGGLHVVVLALSAKAQKIRGSIDVSSRRVKAQLF